MMYNAQLVCSLKVNGKILKEKIQNNESAVFIPFGSEYSLLVKNLSGRNAVVHVEIDGREINANKSGFYIQAGRTVELEGFEKNYKTERRFKFIQKTEEISDFRGDKIDDGMIRVTWQFEKLLPEVKEIVWFSRSRNYIYCYTCNSWHHDDESCRWRPKPFTPYWSTVTYGSNIGSARGSSCGGGTISSSSSGDSITNSSAHVYHTNNTDFTSSFLKSSEANCEGITVEGSKSNHQSFGQANPRELEDNIHSMVIVLKGFSEKSKPIDRPVFVREKLQCSTCGRKWKRMEYCPKCGTFLRGDVK